MTDTTVPGEYEHFVYLYRSESGTPKYVGYGRFADRAIAHAGASHNRDLKEWLDRGRFDLTIAGPYASEQEAKRVEAALISALSPEFNVAPGDGPAFLPIGVPPSLGDRIGLASIELPELGRIAYGALLVYLAPGEFLSDGRPKYNPSHPSDEVVLGDMEQKWALGDLVAEWREHPENSPQTLVGVYGPIKHRFVAAAAEIDTQGWRSPDLGVGSGRWRVPVKDRTNLDHFGLRGRRLAKIKFGQFSHLLHIWVDGSGRQRHPRVSDG